MKNDTKTLMEYPQARLHLKYGDWLKQPQRRFAQLRDLSNFEPL